MPLSTCTVTGSWPANGGVAATGQVTIVPVQSVTGGGQIVAAVPITVPLVNGAISKVVFNNAEAVNLQYRIIEQIRGTEPVIYIVTPAGSTLDLSTAPRGTGPLAPLYILASTIGQANGVASLDGTGHIPSSQLPVGSGVLSVAAANATIVIGGTGVNPTIAVGTIAEGQVTGLTGDLSTLANAIAATVPLAVFTTKGDLIAATGAGTIVRVPVGSNGQALVADSTQSAGVKWAAAGAARAIVRRARVTSGSGSGDVPPDTGGSWAEFTPTGTLVVPAAVGDFIDLKLAFATIPSDNTFWDVAVKNGGLVEFLSSGSASPLVEGDPAFAPFSGVRPFGYTGWLDVAPGHLSGGNVTFVMAVKSNNTGKILLNAADPFRWRAINYGTVS